MCVVPAQTSADLGFLMNPGEGAITALAFFTPGNAAAPTHLLSGAADGSIAVWAAGGSWDCMKLLKGHKCAAGARSKLVSPPCGTLQVGVQQPLPLPGWVMGRE